MSKVVIFTRPQCAPCKNICFWLERKGIEYELKDIDEHAEEASMYTNSLFPPIVIIDGQVAKNISEVARLLSA
jgi:glutaredoxin